MLDDSIAELHNRAVKRNRKAITTVGTGNAQPLQAQRHFKEHRTGDGDSTWEKGERTRTVNKGPSAGLLQMSEMGKRSRMDEPFKPSRAQKALLAEDASQRQAKRAKTLEDLESKGSASRRMKSE